jgi:hypothetical protein
MTVEYRLAVSSTRLDLKPFQFGLPECDLLRVEVKDLSANSDVIRRLKLSICCASTHSIGTLLSHGNALVLLSVGRVVASLDEASAWCFCGQGVTMIPTIFHSIQ